MKTTRFAALAFVCACTLALGACSSSNRTDAAASTTEVKACEKGKDCCKTTGGKSCDSACSTAKSCSGDASSAGTCSDKSKTMN